MRLEVKYIFPTSTPGENNYIYKLPEGLGMRKILAHGTRIQKNTKNTFFAKELQHSEQYSF